ncbi:alkaline phosphatase [Stackebrandtia albiflava]|uniref:Alkaline phosphatase n=1 Tax=Stackebrandtia albiflava TaxID=406432 RepID=A0A562URG6_9ACTN|nr:alkaline phosphatase [Stackebrandtia albiflava]TWJ08206.1 alkaline phosphatase [Stackebrandtia albiflava]
MNSHQPVDPAEHADRPRPGHTEPVNAAESFARADHAEPAARAGQDPTARAADGKAAHPTRRSLFKIGGGAVAAAAVVGALPGTATAAETATTPTAATTATIPANTVPAVYSTRDPHAYTARRNNRERDRSEPQVTILPIDDAKFRAGGRFDLRIEVTGVNPVEAEVSVKIKGPKGNTKLAEPEYSTAAASDQIVVSYPQMSYPAPGEYTVNVKVKVKGGRNHTEKVTHTVVGAGEGGAKNVIFFLGDGMGQAAITAARILSKGMKQGRYRGLLAMDTMDERGLVGTSGADSIATDSANSMSAYMCGHKSSVNAMGVYESSETDPNRHPRVETMAELVKRTRGMSVGVVSTAEVQDATPAAVWAHTRTRSEYAAIMDQALTEEQMPDVLMGGGLAWLLPKSHKGSKRPDERDLVDEFQSLGFSYASTRAELEKAVAENPEKLLGMFHLGNMNVYLDRQHAKNPDVLGDFDDQPTLMEMTSAALKVLERNEGGFFLMVEGASIDKMEHPLDGPRAVYDAIELDKAVQVAKEWAEGRDDTLIVVTADHNHAMSIAGTHRADAAGRDGNGVYGDAGFPTYVDSDGDGFPDDPNPDVQLFFGWSNHPDHTDDFHHNHTHLAPAVIDDATGKAVPNPERDPEAELQLGNLPLNSTSCVHTVEDVSVFASGPGSRKFNAFNDNTDLFHHMIDALGIDATA